MLKVVQLYFSRRGNDAQHWALSGRTVTEPFNVYRSIIDLLKSNLFIPGCRKYSSPTYIHLHACGLSFHFDYYGDYFTYMRYIFSAFLRSHSLAPELLDATNQFFFRVWFVVVP